MDVLWLANNQIRDISPLKGMSGLTFLGIPDNQVSDLSPLMGMTGLKILLLSNNQISDLTPLKGLTSLKELWIDYNQIIDLSPLGGMVELESLSFDSNQVSDLSPLKRMMGLIELWFTDNKISDLSPLKGLTGLKFIVFEYNQISDLTPLKGLTGIESLEFDFNQINDLSPLKGLNGLTNLTFTHNNISDLLQLNLLLELRNLRNVHLHGNPIEAFLPKEELKAGWSAIRNYLISWQNENLVKISEAKVLLLGNTSVGKSTLLDYIKNYPVSKTINTELESTHGIRYYEVQFEQPQQQNTITLHCWDFGGQEYFHATHKLFFSPGALHILLWMDNVTNSRTEGADTDANFELLYWLRCIEQVAGKVQKGKRQVLVVENKLDLTTITEDEMASFVPHIIDQIVLANRFPSLSIHYTAINLIPEKYLAGFIELLKEKINTLPILNELRPSYYQDYIDAIRIAGANKACLDLSEIKVKQGRSDELRQTLPVFHNMGFLLYFHEILPRKIFVEPQKLLDLFYSKILNQTARKKAGRLSEADIKKAIKGNNLGLSYIEVIKLIRHFSLGFQIYGRGIKDWFFPQYLGKEEKGWIDLFARHHFTIPNVRISSDSYLMNQALLELFSNYGTYVKSAGKTNDEFLFWKDGIVIEKGNQLLLVRYNRPQQCFELYGDHEGKNIGLQKEVITYIVNLTNEEEKRTVHSKLRAKSTSSRHVSAVERGDKANDDSLEPTIQNLDVRQVEFANWECSDFDIWLSVNGKQYIQWRKLIESKIAVVENANHEVFFLKDFKRFLPQNKMPLKKLFISYSKKDLAQVNKFIDHLSSLKRNGMLESWYCTDLEPGDVWEDKIKSHLDEADIICFMLSSNFTRTDYIYQHEIPRAISRHHDPNDNVAIVPVMLNFCDWNTKDEKLDLGKFNALPYTLKPVSDFPNEDMAWYIIIEALKTIIVEPHLARDEWDGLTKKLPADVRGLLERIIAGKDQI